MELTLNTHYKYDEWARYFYLTPTGAELITGIQVLDNDWITAERRLKSQGKILKSIMSYSINNEVTQYSRQDIIEYKQYKNQNEEQNAIFYMLGELAEWSWDSDADRMTYEDGNPYDILKLLPMTIKQMGRKTGLIFMGRVTDIIPEDEYQVGY